MYCLGKLPAKIDKRTIKLLDFLTPALPPPPPVFDCDTTLAFPVPCWMLGNDVYGDCVMVGRANQTFRFEGTEQGTLKKFKTQKTVYNAVVKEYFKESGGQDSGLVMLDSLNLWRQKGWKVGCTGYNIFAFAAVNHLDSNEVKLGVSLLNGLNVGIQVPKSAIDQFEAGQPWTVVPGSPIEGGHCIFIVGYNDFGPVCVTWGKKQPMSWPFFFAQTDEAYAVVDNKDKFLGSKSNLNIPLLESYLQAVEGCEYAHR